MPIDRRQKKKKKREEKRKSRRIQSERKKRQENAEKHSYDAHHAFIRGDYDRTLTAALRSLKSDPHDSYIRGIAIRSAVRLKKEAVVLPFLYKAFTDGVQLDCEEHILLGQLAFTQRNYDLAQKVFHKLKADQAASLRLLTKTQIKTVTSYLESCDLFKKMLKENPALFTPASSTSEKTKKKAALAEKTKHASLEEKKEEKLTTAIPEILVDPEITYELRPESVLSAVKEIHRSNISKLELTLQAFRISFRSSYDQLLCLSTVQNMQSLWYQEETARKVLKMFRGRAILADEVGLGKTIEACLCLKEYIMRGLVHSALILAPSNLVNQWQSELDSKFQLSFISSNDPLFRQDPDRFWNSPFILASIQTAKSKRHFDAVVARSYDIVIVDEAHHLKNRTTMNWKLINVIPRTFLLLLTATPVQNNLEELYNLVTLLRPGHLKTRKAFKSEFITRGNPTDPQNREKLRQLLKEVMVRNTRSVTQLHLPPRFASTVRVSPSVPEEKFYHGISDFVVALAKSESLELKPNLQKLLEASGSSHFAALRMLENIIDRNENGIAQPARELLALGQEIHLAAKTQHVLELLLALPDQKIVFVNYIATLEYLQKELREHRIPHVVYYGSMSSEQKQVSIDEFRKGCSVFLATGSGGEGHNLQYCHTMINYDLPWNPMEIEQRIGRIHRIGQEKEVQVYNFCAAGSIEDHILEVLDRKINMFELVVGEIDMILGRLKNEQEFSDMVYEIWVQNPDAEKRKHAFNALSTQLQRARKAHVQSKELDEKLFQEDFGV
jgi:SNF2 family DNA or RNA helicase